MESGSESELTLESAGVDFVPATPFGPSLAVVDGPAGVDVGGAEGVDGDLAGISMPACRATSPLRFFRFLWS